MIRLKIKKPCRSSRTVKLLKANIRVQKTQMNNRSSIFPKFIEETLIAKIIFWSTKASIMKIKNLENQPLLGRCPTGI